MPRYVRGIFFLRIAKIVNFQYNKDYKSLRAYCVLQTSFIAQVLV